MKLPLNLKTLAAAGDISWPKWGARVLHYWAGDATGIAMLAPPLLLLLRAFPSDGPQITLQRPTVEINIRPKGWDVLEWVAEVIAVGLKELKCEEGQGYFFSRPLTSQAAPRW